MHVGKLQKCVSSQQILENKNSPILVGIAMDSSLFKQFYEMLDTSKWIQVHLEDKFAAEMESQKKDSKKPL